MFLMIMWRHNLCTILKTVRQHWEKAFQHSEFFLGLGSFFCVCTCVWMTQPALWQQEKKVNISVCKGNSNALTHCNLSSVSAPVNTEALCSLPPPPVRRWVTETAELGTCSCLKFCYNKKCYFLHFPWSETDRGGRLFNFNWTGPDDK